MERKVKETSKKIKLMLSGITLGTSLLLTGCGKQVSDVKEAPTTQVTEDNKVSTEINETNLSEIDQLAQSIFTNNKEYFESSNDYEDKSYTVEDVKKAIKLVNGDYQDLSEQDVIEAYSLIEDATCPFDWLVAINEYYLRRDNNIGDSVSATTVIETKPNASDLFLEDSSSKKVVKEIDDNVNELGEFLSDGVLTDGELETFNNKVINMFHDKVTGDSAGESDTNKLGENLTVQLAKFGYLKLAQAVNEDNEWIYIDNSVDLGNGQKIGLKINLTPEERIIVSRCETRMSYDQIVSSGLTEEEARRKVAELYGISEMDEVFFLNEASVADLYETYKDIRETMIVYNYDCQDEIHIILESINYSKDMSLKNKKVNKLVKRA